MRKIVEIKELILKEIEDTLGEINSITEMAMERENIKLLVGISTLLMECLEKIDTL